MNNNFSTLVALDLNTGRARATNPQDEAFDVGTTAFWFIRPTETARVKRVLIFLFQQWEVLRENWIGTSMGYPIFTDEGLSEYALVEKVLASINSCGVDEAA